MLRDIEREGGRGAERDGGPSVESLSISCRWEGGSSVNFPRDGSVIWASMRLGDELSHLGKEAGTGRVCIGRRMRRDDEEGIYG